jgi:hypothetical protein
MPMPPTAADPRSDLRAVARFLIPFGALFLIPGIGLFRYQAGVLRDWHEIVAEGAGGRIASYRYKKSMSHRPRFELAYRFDHRDYRTPASASPSRSLESAQRELSRYSRGTRHTILVNPANPHEIILDAGRLTFWLLPAVFSSVGVLLIAIGIWAWRRARRSSVRQRRARSESAVDAAALARNRKGRRIAAGVFLVIGLAMVAGALWQVGQALRILLLPTTDAYVIESVFERLEGGARGTERYSLRLRLRLDRDGLNHSASAFTGPESRYAYARWNHDRAPSGARIPVRYGPGDPSVAYLPPDWRGDRAVLSAILAFLGIVFAACGAAAWRTESM